jgi:hypothetical protein
MCWSRRAAPGKKEKAVTALTADLNRKAARALARKVVKDACAIAATGMITKAESETGGDARGPADDLEHPA